MTPDRRNTLFEKMLSYIFELEDDYDIYAHKLLAIGFSTREVIEELTENCGINEVDAVEIVKEADYEN